MSIDNITVKFEENLKVILYKVRKTSEMIINYKGTRMVKDGERRLKQISQRK